MKILKKKKKLTKKNAILLVLPIEEISIWPELSSPLCFRIQGCSVVNSVMFSGNLSNLEKNQKISKNQKNVPKNQNIHKTTKKLQKNL